MVVPEEMSRDELIVLVRRQDAQISAQAGQIAELVEANEALAGRLARVEHLLSRNSANSSSPLSKDEDLGRTPPPEKPRGRGEGPARRRGKQPGAPGANLAWREVPEEHTDRFPEGRCECGHDLADAVDLGVAESYQQHEIPTVSVTVTQYDQHRVRCGCARVQTAARPEGAWSGPVGYGPNLQAFTVSLMVVHFVPAHRCVAVLESLTGAAPRVGFGHGMLERTAALLSGVTRRIRALITGAPAVCCDETPIKVGPSKPQPGTKKAERYLLLACTERFTHSLLGDRSMQTFTTSVVAELTDSVIVHDRYQNYDSTALGELTHQLCCQHLLRDLVGAGEAYPDAHWPNQIADALRSLIHQANLARDHHQAAIDTTTTTDLIDRFRSGGRVGLCDTLGPPDRPGQRKARLLLDVLRDRQADAPHASPPTSPCPPPPTKPNATCGQPRCTRTSPDASPAKTAPKTATPSAATSPPPPHTTTT